MLIIFHFPLFHLFIWTAADFISFSKTSSLSYLWLLLLQNKGRTGPSCTTLFSFLLPFLFVQCVAVELSAEPGPVRRSAAELHPELLFFLFGVGDEPRTSCLLGRHSTSELYPQLSLILALKQPKKYFFFRIHLRFMRLWVILFVFLSLCLLHLR